MPIKKPVDNPPPLCRKSQSNAPKSPQDSLIDYNGGKKKGRGGFSLKIECCNTKCKPHYRIHRSLKIKSPHWEKHSYKKKKPQLEKRNRLIKIRMKKTNVQISVKSRKPKGFYILRFLKNVDLIN